MNSINKMFEIFFGFKLDERKLSVRANGTFTALGGDQTTAAICAFEMTAGTGKISGLNNYFDFLGFLHCHTSTI
ncbi:MAG TPA: hypothetical protein DC017_09715 [Candidatus Wallbacteria bacterium]|nr:hypothetical protein [Candidatus Wallbacteria bacterium]